MFREQQIIVKKHNKKLQNQNNNANRKKKRKNVLGMEHVKHLTIAKIPVALRNTTTNLFKTQKANL
jgi:hypothetical protein